MPIKVLFREGQELRMRVVGEGHTSLQMLRERLNNHDKIEYANYFPGHPDLDDPEFYIRTKGKADPAKVVNDLSPPSPQNSPAPPSEEDAPRVRFRTNPCRSHWLDRLRHRSRRHRRLRSSPASKISALRNSPPNSAWTSAVASPSRASRFATGKPIASSPGWPRPLGIPKERIFFAGTKDKRAITRQFFVIDAPANKVNGVD